MAINTACRLPKNVTKIPASPHDKLTVATSQHVGMQAIYKDLVLVSEQLLTQPSVNITHPSADKHKSLSPWYGYTTMVYSNHSKGDISAWPVIPLNSFHFH